MVSSSPKTGIHRFFLAIYSAAVVASLDEHVIDGHTRHYHIMDKDIPSIEHWNHLFVKWSIQTKSLLDQGRLRRNTKDLPSIDEIEKYIATFKPAFTEATDVLKKLVNHSAVLSGRLKSASSVHEKLERKGYDLKDLTDIIGMRLTCQTVDETLRIKDLISADQQHFEVMETTCYGMCPGAGKYKESGYRRIHLILLIKSENKTMELQIGTPYTNMWADWDHDLVYKGPKEFADDESVKTYSIAMADYFLKLDQERNQLPDCPAIMEEVSALDILRDNAGGADARALYEKLGYPPNACFWWNDMKLALPSNAHGAASSIPLGILSLSIGVLIN